MLRRTDASSPRDPDGDGHLDAPLRAVVQLRDLRHDLIEGRVDEAVELDLDHRAVAAEREPDRCTDDAGLRQRGVDHTRGAELVQEPIGDAEHPTELPDVLAEEHDLVVVAHRLAESCAEGLSERKFGHAQTSPSKVARYAAYSSRWRSSPVCGSA